jgi:Concanavalin A-like lectin/glucanases superfamily/FG-GAP repeat/Secretion system C-terminal sorting domain/Bacterial Ig-like domain
MQEAIQNFKKIFVFFFMISLTGFSSAQTIDKYSKLLPPQSITNDQFGFALDMHGNYGLVGAPNASRNGAQQTGEVQALYFNGSEWQLNQTIEAPQNTFGVNFGRTIEMDDRFAFIAGYDSSVFLVSVLEYSGGIVWVYERNGDNWTKVQKLFASDSTFGDGFGKSIAVDGDRLIIGANFTPDSTFDGEEYFYRPAGAAYIFEYDGTSWQETAKLVSQDTRDRDNDNFGWAVALDGDVAMISAYTDDEKGTSSGSIFFFTYNGGEWEQSQKIFASDAASRDYFGYDISMENNRAVITAPYDDNGKGTNAGSFYYFENDGSQWVQKAKYIESGGTQYSYFGWSVDMNENHLVLGAPFEDKKGSNTGSFYIYEFDGTGWQQGNQVNAPDFTVNDYFGHDVAIAQNTILSGAYGDDDASLGGGSVYVVETIARPGNVKISNGKYNNRVKISWANRSDSRDGFKVFREGEEIGTVSAGSKSYFDYDGLPGEIYNYSVSSFNDDWQDSAPSGAIGFVRPNGRIDGTISTRIGAGVKNVVVQAMPQDNSDRASLYFNGNSALIAKAGTDLKPETPFYFEAWVNPSNFDRGQSIVLSDTAANYGFRLSIEQSSGKLIFSALSTMSSNSEQTVISTNKLTANSWNHIAAGYGATSLTVYINGQRTEKSISGEMEYAAYPYFLIGQNPKDSQENFNGYLSELRFWNSEISDSLVELRMNQRAAGNEPNLLAYWPLTSILDDISPDFATNGGHHATVVKAGLFENAPNIFLSARSDATGDYSIRNIRYGELADYKIVPQKPLHGFDPGARNRTLDLNTPTFSSVNFTDTTSFSITGQIVQKFNSQECYVPNVELLVNDIFRGVKTDSKGYFRLSIEESGTYTIRPRFNAHAFSPAQMTFVVDDDILDLSFEDTTTDTLSGYMLAGCQVYIGRADLRIFNTKNPEGCIDTTITTNETSGFYSIVLPAREYNIEMTALKDSDPNLVPNPEDVVNYFGVETVDLSDEKVGKNFIYHKPPQIKISGLPEKGCAPFEVPIMEQLVKYQLRIEVYENFGGDTCLVDTGFVTIYDDIGGNPNEPIELPLVNGVAEYELLAGDPNILDGGTHPYQKLLQVDADVDGEKATIEQWALVTGNRPREQTFATVSPELPLMILRDPAGDQSYSYLEKQSTTCLDLGFELRSGLGVTSWQEVKIGNKTLAGFGVFIETDFWGTVKNSLSVEASLKSQTAYEMCITNSEIFSTSGNQDITGESGDVFIGAAMNMIYALTDVIAYDADSCKVDTSTQIIVGNDGFATTFIYTEDHIRHTLIPQLAQLRDLYNAQGSDSARTYANQIDVWQQTLERNRTLKEQATFVENRSFSAGARYESTSEVSRKLATSLEFNLDIERSIAAAAGAEIAGTGVSGGAEVKFRFGFGASAGISSSTTNKTGFVLDDDDVGDFFSIDIKQDEVYGTPVFDLVSGRSSCPWEPGSQARDGVQMSMDSYVRNNVPMDEKAAFILFLGNTSQSDETRQYALSVIQSSNLDGAIISVGGVVIEDALDYTIPAGEQLTATLAVERGPLASDYENLKVRLYSPCDQSISDTISFSVHYDSPCSNVNIFRPENEWLVNIADNDTLPIILNNYDVDDASLESIKLEYRKKNQSWKTAFSILKKDIPEEYITWLWDVSQLENGEYELRAVARCGSVGISYSPIAKGRIDRTALAVFGKPQPADGILNLDEDIKITFTESLDCDNISANNVRLFDENGEDIAIDFACSGKELIITSKDDLANYEGQQLTAKVSNIKDVTGNLLTQAAIWKFTVNQNPLYWSSSNLALTFYKGEVGSISKELINVGGQSASYTLSSLPEWLKTSTPNGSIPAGGTKEISFQISDALNPGSYSDTLFAQTAKGDEALFVELTVLAQPPVWQVNIPSYTYSMNITAQFNIEGNPSDDPFDMVSAFVGNSVRGVNNVQLVSDLYGYLAFITIYSNSPSGEQISFRGWDASEGNEYGNVGEQFVFQDGSELGSVSNPVILNPQGIAQNIDLAAGWTWISLNVEEADMSPNAVLENVNAQTGDIIKSQNEFAQFIEGSGWQGSLEKIETGKAYFIKLNNPAGLRFIGRKVDNSVETIFLDKGWNWIGYNQNRINGIGEALANLDAQNGDRIKSQNAFAEFNAQEGRWLGSLEFLKPGEGYLVKSNSATNFSYNGLNKTNVAETTEGAPESWVFSAADYEYNMSLVAQPDFKNGSTLDSLDIVATFVNGECRGVTKPVFIPALNRFQVFLTIFDNDARENEVSFKMLENESGIVYSAGSTVPFRQDSLAGSIIKPVVLKAAFATNEGALPVQFKIYQNYPNPFNPSTTIRYELPTRVDVKVTIFNLLGQQVAVLVNKAQNAGRYKIDFDAASAGLSSGLYFYRIKAGKFTKVHKMLLVK